MKLLPCEDTVLVELRNIDLKRPSSTFSDDGWYVVEVPRSAIFTVAAAWNTRPPVVIDEVVERALAKAEAQIDENERAMIEERKGQYGPAFKAEQLAAIQGLHQQQRNGVKLVRAAITSMPAVVSGGQSE